MTDYDELSELSKERQMGGFGTETSHREIRRIDLSDFNVRRAEITEQVWDAARDIGFFQVFNHGIDLESVRQVFQLTEQFFALPDGVKAKYPFERAFNAGWESRSQVRPSIATPDQKESYQITRPHMTDRWPSADEYPGFRQKMLDFEAECWQVAMRVLSCFADKLGFDTDFFAGAHHPDAPGYQSTLRLLHYFATEPDPADGTTRWRAGAHTDFDCLTLLFQQDGQGGLEVCPGKESDGQRWSPIEPSGETITCNIGDMLTRWSDDQLPSNFHRVRSPRPGEYQGDRYSIASLPRPTATWRSAGRRSNIHRSAPPTISHCG
jgi:isopenicillin N synthase-like dioxygenase